MTINIHPLQDASWRLLRDLYIEKKLPITKGMSTAISGYYPSIEDILFTLGHYKDEALVISFVDKNSAIIETAKEALTSLRVETIGEEAIAKSPDGIDDIFRSSFEWINAYSCVKSVSLKAIEEGLSGELSRVCGEELVVEITSVQESIEEDRGGASLTAKIKPKNAFR